MLRSLSVTGRQADPRPRAQFVEMVESLRGPGAPCNQNNPDYWLPTDTSAMHPEDFFVVPKKGARPKKEADDDDDE